MREITTDAGSINIFHSTEAVGTGAHKLTPGWYFEPTDYDGDVPFSSAYRSEEAAEHAAQSWAAEKAEGRQ